EADGVHAAALGEHRRADDLDEHRGVVHRSAQRAAHLGGLPFRRRRQLAGRAGLVERRDLRDRLPGRVPIEPADVRLVGDCSRAIEPQDVRPVVRALDHGGDTVAREAIDDLDHIARGGCGWGDGILTHVRLYRRVRARVEHFFLKWVRILAYGDADARSWLCDW